MELGYSSAYAHTTVHVEQYEIEVGWDVEPPVVGFRNAIVYEISKVLLKESKME